MMKKVFLLCLVAACLLASCKVSQNTRGHRFALMYEERPKTIVILPPFNRSDSLDVGRNLASALYMPLCEKGYYVIPPASSAELLAGYGTVDSATVYSEAFLSKLRKDLGADAALFSEIRAYDEGKSRARITLICSLLSTKTGRDLYKDQGEMSLKRSKDGALQMPGSKVAGGLIVPYVASNTGDMLGSMALGMVGGALMGAALAKAEYVSVLQDLPVGRYEERFYLKDSTQLVSSPWVERSVSH